MDQNLETLRAALVDRYDVEKPIGRGGMATVYLANDRRHNRRVAIKVMSPELAATIGAERFSREVKIAAKLTHPNVLGVFDSGETQGLLFYVMPFIEGESLRDKLMRDKQLSIDESIQITCEVADALAHAHAQGIVHRDVKPENILLQNGHALVADFGIARLAEQGQEKLTKTGMAVGTAAYMSPEQASGESTDSRSDIYALGCVLYEMLIGQPPFMGANAMSIMAQHSMATLPEIRVMRHSVPDELEMAIRRAMEKSPADRFQTMEEFKQAVLGEVPATSTHARYTARYRVHGKTRQPASRTRKLLWAGAGVAVVAVAVAATQILLRPKGSAPGANRIAVLYFSDETGGAMEHVAEGLTESLIDRLSGVTGISVVPANGVRDLRGRAAATDTAQARFGVGTVVRGSVAREGSNVNVTVNVVDAASGARIDGKSISVDTSQVLTLQGMVADEVAGFLREVVGTEVSLKEARGQTRSTAAWTLAERAARMRRNADSLILLRSTDGALAALASADSLLVLAQAEDGRWTRLPAMRASNAVARAGLLPRQGPGRLAVIDSGLVLADAALKMESSNPNALEAKGRLQYAKYDADPAANRPMLDSAEETLNRAVQANAAQAGAWATLSNLHYRKQEIAEANRAARLAYESDAYLASANSILRRLFSTSYDLELNKEAKQWCDRGHKRFPADPFFVECRLWMYTTKLEPPNIDSAWIYQRQYVEMNAPAARINRDKFSRILVAGALARTGRDADSARHVLLSARATPDIDPERELTGYEAFVRVILGDHDEAVDLIQSYALVHPEHLKGFVTRVSPWWRDLQGNKRFQRLIATAK